MPALDPEACLTGLCSGPLSPGSFTWWPCLSVLHSSQAWCLSSLLHSLYMAKLCLPFPPSRKPKNPKILPLSALSSYWLLTFSFINQNQSGDKFPEATCRHSGTKSILGNMISICNSSSLQLSCQLLLGWLNQSPLSNSGIRGVHSHCFPTPLYKSFSNCFQGF